MTKKVDRAERARQDRMREKPKEPVRAKPRESNFDQVMKKGQLALRTATRTRMPSKTATEHAIREAVKHQDKRGDEQKKDDRKDKEEGRDSRQKGRRPEGKIAGEKVIAKGRPKHGGGRSSGGKQGGFGMSSGRRGMSKVLKKAGAKSLPLDLRGRFAKKLADSIKTASTPGRAQLTQQVLNKIVQYVRVGINTKGEKEIQMELHERIFRGLKLRVIARGGKVGVIFGTSDRKGREILEKNRDGIFRALKDKGIEVDDIEIT